MAIVTTAHFGGNIVLIKDSAKEGSPFLDMLDQVRFSSFRYPGGSVAENHTWANGGLQKIFGPPMVIGAAGYVMTVREALQLSIDEGSGLTIVIPTGQFWDADTRTFDHAGFDRYLVELGKAIAEYPEARINGFEIGNEYWASHTNTGYGAIANHEIPALHAFRTALADLLGDDWQLPTIGIQAGRQWVADGHLQSREIASSIDMANRALVEVIYQHHYPNMGEGKDWHLDRAVNAMREYLRIPGFDPELRFSVSELNTAKETVVGTNQAGKWIEVLHGHVEAGTDEILHWGLAYNTQANKLFDTGLAAQETEGGRIRAVPTPVGIVYDIASTSLVGKRTISDTMAASGFGVPAGIGITGFAGDGQRVVFLHNDSGTAKDILLDALKQGYHVTVQTIVPADSPYTTGNEALTELQDGRIPDARGDMNVVAGRMTPDSIRLGDNEIAVITITEPGRDLVIEGGHHTTDPRTGMTNDAIHGGSGHDRISGLAGNDTLAGAAGNDRLLGGRGHDHLDGGTGQDVLAGGEGEDRLFGGAAGDMLIGGAGADRLDGGAGRDRMIGGEDADVFIFDFDGAASGTESNAILGLERGDRLDLRAMDLQLVDGPRFTGRGGDLLIEDKGSVIRLAADLDGDRRADFELFVIGGTLEADILLL